MEARKRHRIIWKAARPAVYVASWLLFNYSAPIYTGEGPVLVMSNHNADMDPLLTAYSFPEPLYFVASEHILRQGKISDFLRWATEIIPRQKGGNASATVRNILRHTKEGCNVCIYPEGNRSWDGETRAITPATGKLARMSGATLITYRTSGVYLSNPRWSGSSLRRGAARGEIVGIYEPELLRQLSAAEVQEIIERDLYENAYDRQRANRIKFKGKNLAEHLETLLFMCPHCKTMHKMRSQGDYFICDECGTKLRYTEEGFFEGENMIFDSVIDWRLWQSAQIKQLCENAGEKPVFRDTCMDLYKISCAEKAEFICSGNVELYADRLVLPDGTEIKMGTLGGMSILGAQDLYFSTENVSYALRSSEIRCTSKYLTACKMLDTNVQYGI